MERGFDDLQELAEGAPAVVVDYAIVDDLADVGPGDGQPVDDPVTAPTQARDVALKGSYQGTRGTSL